MTYFARFLSLLLPLFFFFELFVSLSLPTVPSKPYKLEVDSFTGELRDIPSEKHETIISIGKYKGRSYREAFTENEDYFYDYVLVECLEKKWKVREEFKEMGEYAWEMWRRNHLITVAINDHKERKYRWRDAAHAVNTGMERPENPHKSWIDMYEYFTDLERSDLMCCVQEKSTQDNSGKWINAAPCPNRATLGAHIFVKGNYLIPAIVPMCTSCNNKRNFDLDTTKKYKFHLRDGTMILNLLNHEAENSALHKTAKYPKCEVFSRRTRYDPVEEEGEEEVSLSEYMSMHENI